MANVSQLGSFPNTIRNLDDRPNLSPSDMKDALQADCAALWQKCIEIILALNGKVDGPARDAVGLYVGNASPASMASSLKTGDVYLYVPDLP